MRVLGGGSTAPPSPIIVISRYDVYSRALRSSRTNFIRDKDHHYFATIPKIAPACLSFPRFDFRECERFKSLVHLAKRAFKTPRSYYSAIETTLS